MNKEKQPSRREFLKILGFGGVAVGLAACTPDQVRRGAKWAATNADALSEQSYSLKAAIYDDEVAVKLDPDGNPYPFSLTMYEHDEVKDGKVVGTGAIYSLTSEEVSQMITDGQAQVRSYARVEVPASMSSQVSFIEWSVDEQPDPQTPALKLQMNRWRYGDERANVTFSVGLTDRGGAQDMQQVSPFLGCDVEDHPLNDGTAFVDVELDPDGNPYPFSLTMYEHDEARGGKVVGAGRTYFLTSEEVSQMITDGQAQVRSYARVEVPDNFKSHASFVEWTAESQPDAQTPAVRLQMDRWRYSDDRANVTFSMGLTDRGGAQDMQEVSPFLGCDIEQHPLNDGIAFVDIELH